MESLIENRGASLKAAAVNKIINEVKKMKNDYQKIKQENDTLNTTLQDLNQKQTSAASVESTTPTISVEEHEKQMLELRNEIAQLKSVKPPVLPTINEEISTDEEELKQQTELFVERLEEELLAAKAKITELMLQIENVNNAEQKTNGHVEKEEEKTSSQEELLKQQTEITSLKQEVVVAREKITELMLQIENAKKPEQKTNGHVESKADKTNPDAVKVTQQAQIIKDLEQEVNKYKTTIKELTELKEQVESNALLIQESLKKQIDELNTTPYPIKPAIMHEAQIKQKRAEDAIEHLKTGISNATTPTDADKALEGIIACLTAGLEQADPKTYFEQNKDLLKKHVNTLQYTLKSFVNTAVNAILTVLAICSIVGITALWLTGTLQSNLENKGSSFAFWTYGHKQKAEQDIHLATSAMLGTTKGG